MPDKRQDSRGPKSGMCSLSWKGRDGTRQSVEARAIDVSASGLGVECGRDLPGGTAVHIENGDASSARDGVVRHSTRRGLKFHLGIEYTASQARAADAGDTAGDYYEILQISPKADAETIHRVFRIMAARFHPDNPETGNLEEFLRLKRAYAALSDPERRVDYDRQRMARETGTMPIFELKDFVTGVEAEANRRLGVLALLYNQRRADPDHAAVSLLDLEQRMGFPREYLNFTIWYLRAKKLIIVQDNSDFALTAEGVDYVEGNAGESELVGKLLKPGSGAVHVPPRGTGRRQEQAGRPLQFLLGSAHKSQPVEKMD